VTAGQARSTAPSQLRNSTTRTVRLGRQRAAAGFGSGGGQFPLVRGGVQRCVTEGGHMRTRAWMVSAVVAATAALAACGQESPGAAQPSPTAGGQVASCVVGKWRSTKVGGEVSAGPVTLTVAGAD